MGVVDATTVGMDGVITFEVLEQVLRARRCWGKLTGASRVDWRRQALALCAVVLVTGL